MALIVKRKVRETWREAVEKRVAHLPPDRRDACLASFDSGIGAGASEAEAAYGVLAGEGLLWTVEGAGFTTSKSEPEGGRSRHAVPTV